IFHEGKPDGGDLHAQARNEAFRRSTPGSFTLRTCAMKKFNQTIMGAVFENVAQIYNLPYRRIEFCVAMEGSGSARQCNALPSATRRYSRVQLGATVLLLAAALLSITFSATAQNLRGGSESSVDRTLLDNSGIAARPEQIKFPPLDFQPPAPEQFRVQLKSGPIAYVIPDKELPLVSIAVYVHT